MSRQLRYVRFDSFYQTVRIRRGDCVGRREYDHRFRHALTVNEFVYAAGTQPKRYYVLIGPAANPKEGHTYFINSNTNNQLTVDTTQDNLTGIPSNGTVQLLVIPYWTPATLFPASDANVSFTPTTSARVKNTASDSELRRRRH